MVAMLESVMMVVLNSTKAVPQVSAYVGGRTSQSAERAYIPLYGKL